jgi:hypothetical protein
MRRRDVLVGLGAAAVGTGSVRARHSADGEYERSQPDHVSLEFPQAELETYRPALDLGDSDRSRLQGLWAWRATSPEYDLDWYVYFTVWTHQTGVTDYDSHLGDREPVYVGVNTDSGDIERVLFSAYHWLRGGAQAPGIPLTDETHPAMQVIAPWHHYTLGEPGAGILPDVNDLASGADGLSTWLANGLREDLRVGAVHNPAIMQVETDWWRDDLAGRLQVFQLELFRVLGIADDGGLPL